jgi:hypothetical protein
MPEGECNPGIPLSILNESQVESREYQDNSYIYDQPFPQPVSEKKEIYTEDDGHQQQYVNHHNDRSFHSHPQVKRNSSILYELELRA